MMSVAKVLIPNQEWLITDRQTKIGSIAKNKKGYLFLHKGQAVNINDINEIKNQFGIALFEESIKNNTKKKIKPTTYSIYDYPCRSEPYDPIYSVKQKLPLFAKSAKSKSQYCAGHYIIRFRKGWAKAFCPKLITLERYPYHGPFKTEEEIKTILAQVNKE
jgi:hypothetical protein